MKTNIITVHEEEYSDKSRIIGMLLNFVPDDSVEFFSFKDSHPYIFKTGIYIFFETFIDLMDYLLYGDKKMKRAYMEEKEFDIYYNAENIEGKFVDILNWESDE